MHRCECGHWRCSKLESRRTWYRHKMAKILADQLGAESVENNEPLPVEDAPPPAVDVQQEARAEVNNIS